MVLASFLRSKYVSAVFGSCVAETAPRVFFNAVERRGEFQNCPGRGCLLRIIKEEMPMACIAISRECSRRREQSIDSAFSFEAKSPRQLADEPMTLVKKNIRY
jgi:hypothetical protein